MDKVVYNLDIDETEAMNYGVNRSDVTAQIQMMLRGVPVATFPKENSMDYTKTKSSEPSTLGSLYPLLFYGMTVTLCHLWSFCILCLRH